MREDIIERGQNPADFPIFDSKPQLWRDLEWLWEAFTALSGGRQMGMSGPQPITIAELLAYADYRGIYGVEDREELLHYVQFLDRVFISDFAAKSKARSKQPPQK